jgi:hypothetical protein
MHPKKRKSKWQAAKPSSQQPLSTAKQTKTATQEAIYRPDGPTASPKETETAPMPQQSKSNARTPNRLRLHPSLVPNPIMPPKKQTPANLETTIAAHSKQQLQTLAHQRQQELKATLTLHFSSQVDPTKPPWVNIGKLQVNQMPKGIDNLVSNLKFHNLCTYLVPPLCLEAILGYGLKHCIQHKTPQTNATKILDQLEHDVRIPFRHNNCLGDLDSSDNDEKYDPKIYMKLKDWELDPCTIVQIKEELADFRKQFIKLIRSSKSMPQSNLS